MGEVLKEIPQSITSNIPPFLHFFLTVAGPIVFIGLQLSGFKTVSVIKTNRTVGDLSPLPFFSLFINCVCGVFYGSLISDLTVALPNASGVFFSIYFIYIYQIYNNKSYIKYYYLGVLFLMGLMVGFVLFFKKETAALCIGLLACLLGVIVMASPLATVLTVIKTKNTAALPFLPSLANFFNGLTWAAYGFILAHDPIIYIPNIIGMLSAVFQLSLFIFYGLPPSHYPAYQHPSAAYHNTQSSSSRDINLCPILPGGNKIEKEHSEV